MDENTKQPETAALAAAPGSASTRLSKFVGRGSLSMKYKEGEILMSRGEADGKPCIMVKMKHHESGNEHTLGFTENGMCAFLILGEQMMANAPHEPRRE